MKRQCHRLHRPDALVAKSTAIAKDRRCGARSVHHIRSSYDDYFPKQPRAPRIPRDPPPVPPVYRRRIEAAMAGGGRVRLAYEDARDRRTTRIVVPRAWTVRGENFLADCELRGEPRNFRLDQILDCQAVTEET